MTGNKGNNSMNIKCPIPRHFMTYVGGGLSIWFSFGRKVVRADRHWFALRLLQLVGTANLGVSSILGMPLSTPLDSRVRGGRDSGLVKGPGSPVSTFSRSLFFSAFASPDLVVMHHAIDAGASR